MRFYGAMAVLAAVTGAWAGDGAQPSKWVVTACLNPGANASTMYRGEATAPRSSSRRASAWTGRAMRVPAPEAAGS